MRTWRMLLAAGLVGGMILALTAMPASAGVSDPLKDWQMPSTLAAALKTAATTDVPVCIFSQPKIMDGHKDEGESATNALSRCPGFRDFVRVRVFKDEMDGMDAESLKAYRTLMSRVDLSTKKIKGSVGTGITVMAEGEIEFGAVIITDGEGHIIGFASSEASNPAWMAAGRTAGTIAQWKKRVRVTLAGLGKEMAAKQWGKVYGDLEAVARGDREMSALAESSYPHPGDRPASTIILKDAKAPAKEKPPADVKDLRLFFVTEEMAARAALQKAVADDFAAVEKLAADGNYQEALAAVPRLMDNKAVPEIAAKARELQKEVRKKMQEKGGASSAAGAGPASGASETKPAER